MLGGLVGAPQDREVRLTPLRRTLAEACSLAAVCGVVYGLGACPSIYVGDSGELVAAAYTLGVPHPSGYPLYVLLGKLWTLCLPFGSVAQRMSWFSVVAAAGAVGALYYLARRLELGRAAAALAALVLAFGPSFWSQANIQRVYSLNALFVVASLAALCSWRREGGRGRLWLVFFLAGLGASNHTFMALQGGAIAVYTFVAHRELRRDLKLWLGAGASFTIGLAPYLFLMWRSRAQPRLDWGDPETPAALLRHVLRLTHWSRAWFGEWSDLWVIAGDYLRGLGSEVAWVGLTLAVLGVTVARRLRWPLGLLALIMMLNLAALAAHGSRTDIFVWHRYYIPSYVMLALLVGAGGHWLFERSRRSAQVVWLIPLLLLVTGWRAHDRSRFRLAEEYSRTLLAGLPPGAHLAATDDNILFVLIYLQLVEGARPDVRLVLQGVGDADLQPLRFDPDDRRLYFTHHPNWQVPGITLVPDGLAFRVARTSAPRVPGMELPELLPGESDRAVPRDYLTRNLVGQYHYMRGLGYEQSDWPAAVVDFERAALSAPDNDVLFYNLGLILRRNGRLRLARLAFERADAINSRGIVSNRRVLASERIAETEAELMRIGGTEAGPRGGANAARAERDLLLALQGEEAR